MGRLRIHGECAEPAVGMDHDTHYKNIFKTPKLMQDLLHLLQHRLGGRHPFLNRLRSDTLQRLPGDFVTPDHRQRLADLLWKVEFAEDPASGADRVDPADYSVRQDEDAAQPDGRTRWAWLVVMLEFQSNEDRMMAVRIQSYAALLWLDLHKRGEIDRREPLPPILPVVIYNGDAAWQAPSSIADMVHGAPPPDPARAGGAGPEPFRFLGERYVLLDLQAMDRRGDRPEGYAMTCLARMEASAGIEETAYALDSMMQWIAECGEPEVVEPLLGYIVAVFEARNVPMEGVLDMTIEEALSSSDSGFWGDRLRADWDRRLARAREDGLEAGREEGEAIGQERGEVVGLRRERALLIRLVERRFDAETARRLSPFMERANHERLVEVGDWIVDSASAAELLHRCSRLTPPRVSRTS